MTQMPHILLHTWNYCKYSSCLINNSFFGVAEKKKKHIHGSLKMQWQKQHLKACVQNSPILLLQMETVKEEKQKKQKPAFVSSRAIPYDPGSCIRWFGSFGKAFRVSPWIRHCNTLSSISLAQCHNSFCIIHCTFC